MYRKYVRKWWLLKRNRIICLELAVNNQFFVGKSEFFVKLPKKIEICRKFAPKNRFFLNCLKKIENFRKFPDKIELFFKLPHKSKFFGNLPWKIEIFCEITCKNRNFSEICPDKSILCLWNCLKKSKFCGNFLENRNFLTRIHDPPYFKPDWRCWVWMDDYKLLQKLNLTISSAMQCAHHVLRVI